MTDSPWNTIAAMVRRLQDRVDGLPSIREATVTVASPLTVKFDTDSAGVVTHGTLAAGLGVGDRVLTVRLARYLWVLGRRGGTRDTGWLSFSASGAASGTIYYRRVGSITEVRGGVTGTFPEGNTDIGTIPSPIRPVSRDARGAGYINGGYVGVVTLTTDGTVRFTHRSGASRTTAAFSVVFIDD